MSTDEDNFRPQLVDPARAITDTHAFRGMFTADGARATHPLAIVAVILFSIVLYSVGSAWGDAIRSVSTHFIGIYPDSRIAVTFVVAIIVAFAAIILMLILYGLLRRLMPFERKQREA